MAVMVYKDGQSARIVHTSLQAHLDAGWGLDENHTSAKKEESIDLEQARLAYEEKFGEKPHHKMKLETIIEKLNGD